MNEFQIHQLSNLNFINNAIYLLCVIVMTALAFYLIRRSRELNMPAYAKVVLTLFCTCIIFFGLQVSSFMIQAQKGISYQLSELKQKGAEISSSAEAFIEQFGHTVEMGPAPLAPDLPSIIIWATIAFMFIGGIWFKYPEKK
ncbi:hypothetical protein N8288_01235 [Flavobacteriaceae bacterium]|jgi:hypothetical protein|nr:hypothetical protein [Flavobacteriaceae bacterium]MDC1377959.1 hypothetical protein [Flavobacteriaceae bacterium]|tara:strand:+ start:94 stop:519 length:426 start_codon:yes stop_codon:yes gene_type:complete